MMRILKPCAALLLAAVLVLGLAASAWAVGGTPLVKDESVGAEEHSFTLKKVYFTKQLSEKKGNTTYRFGNEGNYLVLKLKFKNLAEEALDNRSSRFSDIRLVYGGKYEYEGDYRIMTGDIVPLAKANLYIYFPVPESMKEDKTWSLVASFDVDDETYRYVIREGAEAGDEAFAEPALEPALSLSQSRTDGALFSFVFKKLSYVKQLSEKNGSTTYRYGSEDSYLVLKLKFTNLSTESLPKYRSDRFTNMKLVYNDKYEYEGAYAVLVDDIVPLATGNLYIYFQVPKELKNEDGPLVASFTVDGQSFTVDCRAQE